MAMPEGKHLQKQEAAMNKKSTVYDDADRLMAIDEVAERLKTSPTRIAALINGGFIRVVKFGRRRYIRKYTLNMFLASVEGKDLADMLET